MLTANRYGHGQAWYLAATLGKAYYTYGYFRMAHLLEELLCRLDLKQLYLLDAPKSVEIHLERDEQNTLYVHLVNLTTPAAVPAQEIVRSVDEIVPLHGIRLLLPGQIDPETVACDGAQVSAEATEAGIWLGVDTLEDGCTIIVPWASE